MDVASVRFAVCLQQWAGCMLRTSEEYAPWYVPDTQALPSASPLVSKKVLIGCLAPLRTQMGQLYVWGFLKWMMLPMAAVRWVEGTRVLAPLYARPCFIAVSGPSASAGAPGPALPSQAPAR